MSPRAPSRPPRLDGYEFRSVLGGGGFADVFLYRQERPQREVAVKVLLSGIGDLGVRAQFEAEANVMAAMSTHPSIVTIHQAEVADDGRPCIVMEYCSRPNFGVRFRSERIAVEEALRVGVMIAGAVETAHRAGVLHRDIKPANILVTEYNRPALTDFGISIATTEAGDIEDSTGMSIPWSPPECFADPPRADVRSDVFSLAATVYSLLAGRTPFEATDRRNTAAELIRRIETMPLPPLERPDAPASLSRVLAVAMAKDPAARYDSALAFGRALQQVEAELSLPVTAMDVLEDRSRQPVAARAEPDDLDMHTRIRSITTIAPGAPGMQGAPGAQGVPGAQGMHGAMGIPGAHSPAQREIDPFAGIAPAPGELAASRAAAPGESTAPRTMLRPSASLPPRSPLEAEADPDPEPEGRGLGLPPWLVLSVVGALVLAVGVGAVLGVRAAFPEKEGPTPPDDTTEPVAFDDRDVAAPTDIRIEKIDMPGTEVDKARISWSRPQGFAQGDVYLVSWKDMEDGYRQFGEPQEVAGRESMVMNAPPHHDHACVQVAVRVPSGAAQSAGEACM